MRGRDTVTLLADPRWVLGTIARETCSRVNSSGGRFRLEALPVPGTEAGYREIEARSSVVHFLNPWDFPRFASVARVPTVVTYHHIVEGGWGLFEDYHAFADALCAITDGWRAELQAHSGCGGPGLHLMRSGVDGQVFRPDPRGRELLIERLRIPPDALTLGFSASKDSNFRGRKGVDRYVAVLRRLVEAGRPDVRMIVFGSGWTPGDFPEDLRGSVSIPGYLPYEELPGLYNGLDFYLCLSTCEGGPYPVLECMACEVKVISTPVGVVPELIRDRHNGFRVGHEDYLERIPAILDEWAPPSDREAQLRRNARVDVLDRHAWDVVVDEPLFRAIYEDAIRHWRSRPLLERARRRARSLRNRATTSLRDWKRRLGARAVGSPPTA